MEISHASTETQSAAVGISGKAEEVTVSTDAEFMMMIAHGIYSNKALALVRELLCNARDGHAKAGCLDKPIHVTLEDNKLVVRDHGTGIPNPIFAPTYLTFGKSTKRKDKAATGGFGVGSKVPWAVCDTFSARNFIDGTMTAYAIMKSDPALDGKPSCTAIMSIPSTEPSGVEVTVPFPEKMHGDINKCIQHFAAELGIPIVLNGTPFVSALSDYKVAELKEHGWILAPHHPRTVIQNSSFYVRQGDVLYPIERQDEFGDAFDMLVVLNPDVARTPMIFMAEPDSIIPTLSRESLQYTDRTSKSIRDLMKKAMQVLADNIDQYAQNVRERLPEKCEQSHDFVGEMWKFKFNTSQALISNDKWMRIEGLAPSTQQLLMSNMTRWLGAKTPYMETQVTNGKEFREEFKETLEQLFAKQLDKYHYLNKERLLEIREWEKHPHKPASQETYKKVLRNIYEEVMFFRQEMQANPDIIEVYYPTSEDAASAATSHRPTSYFMLTSELNKLDKEKENLFSGYNYNQIRQMMYLSKTVIISQAPQTMAARAIERFKGVPYEDKNLMSTYYGCARIQGARMIRLRAGTKEESINAMASDLRAKGYDVILLMTPTRAEIAEREALAEERARLRDQPLPTLGGMITDKIGTWPRDTYQTNKKLMKNLINNPAFKGVPMYMIIGKGKDLPFSMTSVEDFRKLVKFTGTDIICVSTKPEIARVIKEGRVNVEDRIVAFAKQFLTQPGMHEKLFYQKTFFAKRFKQNRYLTQYLFNRAPALLTPKEVKIIDDLRSFGGIFPKLNKYLDGGVTEGRKYLGKLKLYERNQIAEHYMNVFSRFADDNFCDVHRAFEAAYARKASPTRALARSILKTILKEQA